MLRLVHDVDRRHTFELPEDEMAKLDWDKTRDLGELEAIDAPKKPEVKFGTRTGPKKLKEAREKARDRPYAGKEAPAADPQWQGKKVGQHPHLPAKPPGR